MEIDALVHVKNLWRDFPGPMEEENTGSKGTLHPICGSGNLGKVPSLDEKASEQPGVEDT